MKHIQFTCLALAALALQPSALHAVSINSTYTNPGAGNVPPGKLTVEVTDPGQNWDTLQIQCKQGDTPANYTVVTADWAAVAAPNFIVEKGSGRNRTYHCKFKRSSPTNGNATVEITHNGNKRGNEGKIHAGLATAVDPKSLANTRDNAFVALGACQLPSGDFPNCICNVTDVYCTEDYGGTWLGVDSTCPGECVPTVSEWGLVVLVLLTLCAATVVLMRRRRLA